MPLLWVYVIFCGNTYETVTLFALKNGLEGAVRFIKVEVLIDEPIEGGLEILKPVDNNDVAFARYPEWNKRVTGTKVFDVLMAFRSIMLSL